MSNMINRCKSHDLSHISVQHCAGMSTSAISRVVSEELVFGRAVACVLNRCGGPERGLTCILSRRFGPQSCSQAEW